MPKQANHTIDEICQVLIDEALTPAKKEAESIVENAKKQAEEIIHHAKEEAAYVEKKNLQEVEKQKRLCQDFLQFSSKQAIAQLKEKIIDLFRKELFGIVTQEMQEPDVVKKSLDVILTLLEKEGLAVNLQLMFPKHIDIEELCKHITKKFAQKIRKEGCPLEGIQGGIKVRLLNENFSLDFSESAVADLLFAQAMPELKKMLFS